VMRMSRRGPFWSCNRYPKCEFTLNKKPLNRPCPKCHTAYLLAHETKREGPIEMCNHCDYRAPRKDEAASTS
jgi:DNA topoisomerase I